MTWTPFRIVICVNAVLLALATVFGFCMGPRGDYGSPAAIMNFLAAFWLLPINAVLGIIAGITLAINGKGKPFSQSWAGAFLFSTGLILLINTPLCLAINTFR